MIQEQFAEFMFANLVWLGIGLMVLIWIAMGVIISFRYMLNAVHCDLQPVRQQQVLHQQSRYQPQTQDDLRQQYGYPPYAGPHQ